MAMNVNEIIRTVAEICNCTSGEIKSSRRMRNLVAARKIIASVLHSHTLNQIGRLINRRYSTVQFYRRNFRYDIKYDVYLREKYDAVKSKMN